MICDFIHYFSFIHYMIQRLFLFQVWKAELVLSDFVLHTMLTSSKFDGIVALELGAGTGVWWTCIRDIYFYAHLLFFWFLPFCINVLLDETVRFSFFFFFERPPLTILLFQWQGLILFLLPGLVGILLARVAKTVFLTGIGYSNPQKFWFFVIPCFPILETRQSDDLDHQGLISFSYSLILFCSDGLRNVWACTLFS